MIEMYSTFNTTKLRSKFYDEGEWGELETPTKGNHIIELEDNAAGDNATFEAIGPNAIILFVGAPHPSPFV